MLTKELIRDYYILYLSGAAKTKVNKNGGIEVEAIEAKYNRLVTIEFVNDGVKYVIERSNNQGYVYDLCYLDGELVQEIDYHDQDDEVVVYDRTKMEMGFYRVIRKHRIERC